MPLYIFVGNGSLGTAKQGVIEPGGTVEMTDAEAASMPPGVLKLHTGTVKVAEPVKPLLLVAPPLVAPSGVVKPTPSSTGSRRAKDTKP